MKRIVFALVFVLMAGAGSKPLLGQDNAFVGTWTLNVAKSKFQGMAGPKSMTRTVEVKGNGTKYSFSGMAADGTPVAYSFVTYYDGTEAAITGNGMPAGADSIALKRVNPHKTEGTLYKGGQDLGKVVSEVSSDGKITTVRLKGKAASSESVYEKQ